MTGVLPIRQVRARILERITLEALGQPISVTLTESDDWSPRIQGEIVISDTLDISADWLPGNLWKLQGDVLTLELSTRYGPGFTLADLTAAYGGSIAAVTTPHGGSIDSITRAHTRPWHPGEPIQPLTAATALWGGGVASVTADVAGDMAAITLKLRQPGGSYRIPPTEKALYRLRIRDRILNVADATVTMPITSEDVRLHDYRLTETTGLESTHTSLRGLVTDVLDRVREDAGFWHRIELAGGPDITITDGQEWGTGQTAWEFLSPILEAAGWTLYTAADSRYRLEHRTTTTAPAALDKDANLIEYAPQTGATGAWYDGAVVEYTDAPEDQPSQRYDVYTMPGAQRIMHVTRPGVRSIPGAAEELVNRSHTRGLAATARTVLMLGLHPRQRPSIISINDASAVGTIRQITHTLPDAETTLDLYDITT